MTDERPPTEMRNPATVSIDEMDTEEILRTLYREDERAISAAGKAAGETARAVDAALERVSRGGRIHYFGAGASGRLAMLDAAEIVPTFGAEPGLFTAHFPGGVGALTDPAIDLEDSEQDGHADAGALDETSVAVGISASGTTPYVMGALRRARAAGALVILVTSNPRAPIRALADISIIAETGAEALTGSTRLKAGTAAKVILNAFSTALMIRAGHVFSNLMVGLVATNDKLRGRALGILWEATGMPPGRCKDALREADGSLPVALVSLLAGVPANGARDALARAGSVRKAIESLGRSRA